MYLSRLELNPRSREARRDVGSAYDLHRTIITRGFPGGVDAGERVLFRLDAMRENGRTRMMLLVQSMFSEPDWGSLPEDYCLRIDGPRRFVPALMTGVHLSFRLLANPIARSRTGERSTGVDGSRGHARFHRRCLLNEEEQRAWIMRKGERGGFRPLFTVLTPSAGPGGQAGTISHERKRSIPHVGVRYDGVLEVTDPAVFLETLQSGIGSAKAFGYGLLSIARFNG